MIEFILRGGAFFLLPIGLLSVAALYLIIERAIFFLQSRPAPPLQRALDDLLGGAPPVDLRETLEESNAPEAVIARVGLDARGTDADAQRRLERALLEVVASMEHNVAPLASIANVATHLGLLGTVVGMIGAFIGMGGVATADMTGLTQGISQALVTTAAGLGVAVPASFFNHLYANHVKKRIAELNVTASELDSLVAGPAAGASGAAAPTPAPDERGR